MFPNLLSALVTKITVSNRLDDYAIRVLRGIKTRQRNLGPRELIVAEGDRPHECCLLVEGFAFRSKTSSNGERQVLSLHIPGEIPDLQSLHLHVMDHDLTTLTPCSLAFIAHNELKELSRQHPELAAAFWRETLIDASIFREWIVNVGRRSATQRMAHLLIELHNRLQAIGRTRNGEFRCPITQADLGDCLGLSTVHVNRVIKFLREEGLLAIRRTEFQILDMARMKQLADFDARYLHLDPTD